MDQEVLTSLLTLLLCLHLGTLNLGEMKRVGYPLKAPGLLVNSNENIDRIPSHSFVANGSHLSAAAILCWKVLCMFLCLVLW